MRRLDPDIIDYYNIEVTKMISASYNIPLLEALKEFVYSETHIMLENAFEDID